jgi:molecular chaperone GrpE
VSGTARNSAGSGKQPAEDIDEATPSVVIRDKRKIRRDAPDKTNEPVPPATPPAKPDAAGTDDEEETVVVGEVVDAEQVAPEDVEETVVESGIVEPEIVEDAIVVDEAGVPAGGFGAELAALRAELDERTRDLQRVNAEYANHRKRVERDRALVGEQAVGAVLVALLPILDDLDRAREHGDLVGPFATVADQLAAAVGKFGLTPFGERGDPFDPNRHEAVAHQTSAEVTEPTCVEVMRRGYLLGDRLLRAALVAVADPE